MTFLNIEQKTPEWWNFKVGKISGTRFGAVISGRKNRLIYDIMAEIMNGYIDVDDYENEEMQYGIENEHIALDKYEQITGIKMIRGGVIVSDHSSMHIASPDGHNADNPRHIIIGEVKCTMNIAVHAQRYFEGIETAHKAQCLNYFAQSVDIKEVHFISFCGFDEIRPIHIIKQKRSDFEAEIQKCNTKVLQIEKEVIEKLKQYKSIEF